MCAFAIGDEYHTLVALVRDGVVEAVDAGARPGEAVDDPDTPTRLDAQVQRLVAGMGIAILPDFVVQDALADRSLRALLPEAALSSVAAHALYRVEGRGSPRIEAVLAHMRRTVPLGG